MVFLKSGGEDYYKVSQIKKGFGYGPQYARNNFQLNRDGRYFSDIALIRKIMPRLELVRPYGHYDNDGLNDIFITNGIYKRPNDLDYIKYLSTVDFNQYSQNRQNDLEKKLIDEMPTLKIPNVVFRNTGNFSYQRLTDKAGLTPSYSNGAAYSGLDNDGDLDLVLNNINEKGEILENRKSLHCPQQLFGHHAPRDREIQKPNWSKGLPFCKRTDLHKGTDRPPRN